jgi:competence protein ComFC
VTSWQNKIASYRERTKTFTSDFLNYFFPNTCLSCNIKVLSYDILCQNCYSKLSFTSEKDLTNHFNEYFANHKNVTALYSLLNFEKDSPLQDLIHQLKYNSKPTIGIYLGKQFASKYSAELKNNIDIIIPVPLFHSKKAERGYNQSAFFAKGIGDRLNIKVKNKALKRIKRTKTQTHFSKEERIANVKNSFKVCNKSSIEGKNILIVDDVITTGSTINECINLITEQKARAVFAGSIAIA